MKRNTPILILVGAGVVAGLVGLALRPAGGDGGETGPTTAAPTTTLAAPAPASVTTVTIGPTEPPAALTTLSQTLAFGMVGPQVTDLQERLKALGFEPGPIDGNFGSLTRQAVWAFEKLVMGTPRDQATGQVTNDMWQLMQQNLGVQPKRPDSGPASHTEVYLPEQVAVFFVDNRAALIVHISSGTGQYWEEDVKISPGEYGNQNGTTEVTRRVRGKADTPGGVFHYTRWIQGRRESALGGMYNPVYFNYGIAIHGANEVPLQPASHGCIRMARTISETFQQYLNIGDAVYVFDGVKEPEAYGEQGPTWDTMLPTTTVVTTAPPPSATGGSTPATALNG